MSINTDPKKFLWVLLLSVRKIKLAQGKGGKGSAVSPSGYLNFRWPQRSHRISLAEKWQGQFFDKLKTAVTPFFFVIMEKIGYNKKRMNEKGGEP